MLKYGCSLIKGNAGCRALAYRAELAGVRAHVHALVYIVTRRNAILFERIFTQLPRPFATIL